MEKNGDVLDAAVLEELRQYEGEKGGTLLDDLIAIYLQSAPEALKKIRTHSAAAMDFRVLENEFHSLKSSSGNMGAKRLQALCQTLEKMAAAEQSAEIAAQMPAFEQELAQVMKALAALVVPRAAG